MKKILSLILAGLMTVSCAAFVAADDAAVEATDATQAYAISFLAQNGIYHGKSNEEFVAAAADPIERYQMALFVARISTGWVDDYMWDYNYDWEDNTANNSTFTDLAGTAAESYLGAISYANQKGIIEGYSASKFGPTDGITYRDALTMVVRTMGYQGLAYPWGYIEKAVELGLTEGISGVTYTDALNRGQVAVILYNAMFAPTKSGETLAKSIFDVDFGWETIVITASDEVGFANNGKRAAAGYVGFNLVDANGKIGSKTYYVKEAELGLDKGHAAELAVGSLYNALFTIDGDLASLVDYDSALIAVVANNGITDNAGVAYEKLPMLVALEDYTLVKENAAKEYITFMGNEMFVYEAGTYTYYVDAAAGKELVAIDKDTCNIMYWNQETEAWAIGWYYNETLNKYYDYEINTDTDTLQVNWMSDAEFTKWYAEVSKIAKTEEQYVLKTSFADFGKNPYAKLSLYNADADAVAEVATYKAYKIGNFSNSTMKCKVGNVNGVNHPDTAMPSYKIVGLDGAYTKEAFVEAGHEKHDPNYYANIAAGNGFAWINVADDVIGFVNEDGSYNNGVVIYNWNDLTGEIEVVKYIPENAEGTDADSYIFTGVLQAYSTKGTSITVDGAKYTYGYDSLDGTTMKKGDGGIVARSLVAEELDQYLMQYVKVTVVDGLVVDVDLLGQDTNNVIVVYDYAGITSDGYIAVYGYSTKDATLSIFKINSYNGWKKGDYRYYPENAGEDKAFENGTLYAIKSYNAETNSYGVETYNWFDYYTEAVTMSFQSGYRIFTDANGDLVYDPAKTAASDTYIFILPNGEIFATTGAKVAPGAAAYGDILYRDGGKTVMLVPYYGLVEFDQTSHEVGFVLYDKDVATVLEAAYDDAQDVEDFYLLGSTVSEVRVINLLTGKYDYAFASTNIDLEDGQVYKTIGSTIIDVVEIDYSNANFVYEIAESYWETSVAYAKYIVPGTVITENEIAVSSFTFDGKTGLTKLDIAKALGVIDTTAKPAVQEKVAAAYVAEIRNRLVTNDGNGITIDDITLVEGTKYTAKVVYNVADKVAVVYIYANTIKYPNTIEDIDLAALKLPKTIKAWTYTNNEGSEVEVELQASLSLKAEYEVVGSTKTLKNIILDTITLEFVDKLGNTPHGDLVKAGYTFGEHDLHGESYFYFNDSRVLLDDVEIANASDMYYLYFTDCNAVQKVTFKVGEVIDITNGWFIKDVAIEVDGNEADDKGLVEVEFELTVTDNSQNDIIEAADGEVAVNFTKVEVQDVDRPVLVD